MAALPDGSIADSASTDTRHYPRCRIAISNEGGWDVSAEVNERVVLVVHCTDWHRVERLCTRIGHCPDDLSTANALNETEYVPADSREQDTDLWQPHNRDLSCAR